MMNAYVILLRGINVGGKNRIPMEELKLLLRELGFTDVVTYIASGNVLIKSDLSAQEIRNMIETALPQRFILDNGPLKVLVLSQAFMQQVIEAKPEGFGEAPDQYHSDVIFLIDIEPEAAWSAFSPRECVDKLWQGEGVIYSQRLSAERTKSRLSRIVGTPLYQFMTIRNWNTVKTLHGMIQRLLVDHSE